MFLEATSLCAGVVTLFAIKRLLSTVNQHVSFQMRSFYAWVAALGATVGLPSIVLKHVRFEILGHLKGKIVFSLHFHGVFFNWKLNQECNIISQSGNKDGGLLKAAETISDVELFVESESNGNTSGGNQYCLRTSGPARGWFCSTCMPKYPFTKVSVYPPSPFIKWL